MAKTAGQTGGTAVPGDRTGADAGGAAWRGIPFNLIVPVLAALCLRLPLMGLSLSIDEVNSHDQYTRNGFRAIFLEAYNSNNHPLNAFFSWISISVFGNTEWAIRLPALVFGLATVLLAGRFAREVTGNRLCGWAASLLLAVSPYHVAYSANSRGYSMAMFFALLSGYCLYHALRRVSPAAVAGLGVSLGLMALSHLFFLLLFGAWGLVAAAWGAILLASPSSRRAGSVTAWLLACLGIMGGGLLTVLLYAPSLPLYYEVPFRLVHGMWPEQADPNYEPRWLNAAEGAGGSVLSAWDPMDSITQTVTGLQGRAFWAGLAVALAGTGIFLWRRRWGMLVLLAGAAVPAAAIYALQLKSQNRCYLVILPFFTLCLAAGAAAPAAMAPLRGGSRGFVRGAVSAGIVACLAWLMLAPCVARTPGSGDTPWPGRLGWLAGIHQEAKEASAWVNARLLPGDTVLIEKDRNDFRVRASLYFDRYWAGYPLPEALDLSGRFGIWWLGTRDQTVEMDRLPDAGPMELGALFGGDVAVYHASLPCSPLRRIPVPPLSVGGQDTGSAPAEAAASGIWRAVVIAGRGVPKFRQFGQNAVELTDSAGVGTFLLESPALPAAASKRMVLRAGLRDAGPRQRVYFMARFLDADGAELDTVFMRRGSLDRAAPPGCTAAHGAFVTPAKTASVVVGIFSVASYRRPAVVEVHDLELWADWDPLPAP
jgi:4-amino-4-deoxy-L-arabinose transferase-like glycosyltransferase